MQISAAQLGELSNAAVSGFVWRLSAHLRSVFPEWGATQSDSDIRTFVGDVLALGRQHDIRSPDAVTRVAELCVANGLALPLPQLLSSALDASGETEEVRVADFEREIGLGTHGLREVFLSSELNTGVNLLVGRG